MVFPIAALMLRQSILLSKIAVILIKGDLLYYFRENWKQWDGAIITGNLRITFFRMGDDFSFFQVNKVLTRPVRVGKIEGTRGWETVLNHSQGCPIIPGSLARSHGHYDIMHIRVGHLLKFKQVFVTSGSTRILTWKAVRQSIRSSQGHCITRCLRFNRDETFIELICKDLCVLWVGRALVWFIRCARRTVFYIAPQFPFLTTISWLK